jgi:hypothetical protein
MPSATCVDMVKMLCQLGICPVEAHHPLCYKRTSCCLCCSGQWWRAYGNENWEFSRVGASLAAVLGSFFSYAALLVLS